MNVRSVIRKSVSLILILVLAAGINCVSKAKIYATPNTYTNQQGTVQIVLEQYFRNFFNTLLEDSNQDYSSDDFSGINGYIIAKKLVSTRETYNKLLGGIHNIDIQEVVVDDLTENSDGLEAMVYVKYLFTYGDNSEDEQCTTGSLYRVTLEKTSNSYKVTDIDNKDIEIQRVKDTLTNTNARNTANKYDIVDNYFEEIQENADSLLEPTEISQSTDMKNEVCEVASVSV